MTANGNYDIQDNKLLINDSEIAFDYPIEKAVVIADMLILRLEKPFKTIYNENVFGVSLSEKKIKWQIAKLKYSTGTDCPFVDLRLHNNQLYLHNWCDIYLIVDPLTEKF